MKNVLFLLAMMAGTIFCAAQTTIAPTDKQFQLIEKYMAPLRKKVTDMLEADKTGQYKEYKADLERIAKESDPAKKETLLANLERDHYDFIKTSYKKAVINHEEMRREIARILGHSNFSLGEFGDFQIDFIQPNLVLPQRFDATLNCPFTALDETDNNMVASDCFAAVSDCRIKVESLAEIVGGCRTKGDAGGTFELPEGNFTSIATTSQADIAYRGFALAIGGYGQINAKFGIRFRAPGIDKTVMAKEVHAVAPLVWFRRVKGDVQDFIAKATFTGTFSTGTIIKVQAHTEVFAISGAISVTEMDGFTDNFDFIRISGSN